MTTEFITYNFPSCVCENLILLIVVLERLFWPIVFFAFIGLSISPPENEVNVTNLVIKCDWSEINKDDDNESSESESDGSSESDDSGYDDEEEPIVITLTIKLYRPNYCLRSSKSLIIV